MASSKHSLFQKAPVRSTQEQIFDILLLIVSILGSCAAIAYLRWML